MQIHSINAYPDFENDGKFSVAVTLTGFDTAQAALSAVLNALSTLQGDVSAQETTRDQEPVPAWVEKAFREQNKAATTGCPPIDYAKANTVGAQAAAIEEVRQAAVAEVLATVQTNLAIPAPTATVTTLRPRRADRASISPSNNDAAPAPAAEASAPSTRRQRRPAEAPAAEAPPPPPAITDADLAKAASNTAAIVGPSVVKEVLDDFHVSSVNELHADVRQKFLDELQEEIRLGQAEAAAKAAN